MATSLEARLLSAAQSFSPLASYLGSNPFRWYNGQLLQGSGYPAIVVQLVAGNKTYAFTGRMATGFSRYQFTIWDTDPARAYAVEEQLAAFLDQFNGTGISGLVQYPNSIVMQRQLLFTETQPLRFMRINDAQIFSNDTL